MDQRLPFSLQRVIARAMRRGVADVVGVGNPLLDIIVGLDLDRPLPPGLEWGRAVHLDAAAVDRLCGRFGSLQRCAGGGASNTLAALAALGARSRLVGALGNDAEAEIYREDLRRQGVTDALQTVAGATGRCLIVLPGDLSAPPQRRSVIAPAIVAAPEAAAALDPRHVVRELQARPDRMIADALFIEGFLLGRPRIVDAVLAARSASTLTILSLGHPSVVTAHRELILQRILPAIDLLFANEAEYRVLLGLDEQLDLKLQLPTSWSARLPLTVVTRADRGAALLWAGGAVERPAASAAEWGKAGEGNGPRIIDPTGAGDVFAGAFLAALFAGARIETGLDVANRAALACLTNRGGRIPAAERLRLRVMMGLS